MEFQITPDQVSEETRWLCDIVGMNKFLEIVDMAGGQYVYIPKRATLEKELRHRAIRQEFDGGNLRKLARKYDVSERHIRTILKEPPAHP